VIRGVGARLLLEAPYVPFGRARRRSSGDIRCARSVRVPETLG
jgi:hypothetical protein